MGVGKEEEEKGEEVEDKGKKKNQRKITKPAQATFLTLKFDDKSELIAPMPPYCLGCCCCEFFSKYFVKI